MSDVFRDMLTRLRSVIAARKDANGVPDVFYPYEQRIRRLQHWYESQMTGSLEASQQPDHNIPALGSNMGDSTANVTQQVLPLTDQPQTEYPLPALSFDTSLPSADDNLWPDDGFDFGMADFLAQAVGNESFDSMVFSGTEDTMSVPI